SRTARLSGAGARRGRGDPGAPGGARGACGVGTGDPFYLAAGVAGVHGTGTARTCASRPTARARIDLITSARARANAIVALGKLAGRANRFRELLVPVLEAHRRSASGSIRTAFVRHRVHRPVRCCWPAGHAHDAHPNKAVPDTLLRTEERMRREKH